jgi:uncharacterized delta-60 repeat protein
MLATDPDTRPSGLANWIGQLRRSSLDAGPDLLNPPAPRRHPTVPAERAKRSTWRQIPPKRARILIAVAIMVVLAVLAAVIPDLFLAATPHQPEKASQLTFDPTCGQGKPVTFSSGVAIKDEVVPVAVAVGSSHATVGIDEYGATNGSEGLGGGLLGINPNCSPDPTFAPRGLLSVMLQPPCCGPASLNAMTIGPNGDIYTAGHNQAGWVVARFSSTGTPDPSFGSGGYSAIPEAASGAYASPSAITVASSGEIFVFGNDNNAPCCGKTLLIALRSNGSLDPSFGNHGVVTADRSVAAVSLTMTPDGSLLLGSQPMFGAAVEPCSEFTVEKYLPSGTPARGFTKIVGSGTGSFCPDTTTRIPGYDNSELTSVLSLPGGNFFVFGTAFSDAQSADNQRASVFLVKYHADGSIDRSFGNGGIVTLPGLGTDQMDQTSAQTGPGGGVVVAVAGKLGLSLVSVTPTGEVEKPVHVPTPSSSSSIALGNAGSGRVLVVSVASGQLSVARYLDSSS